MAFLCLGGGQEQRLRVFRGHGRQWLGTKVATHDMNLPPEMRGQRWQQLLGQMPARGIVTARAAIEQQQVEGLHCSSMQKWRPLASRPERK